MTELVLLDDLGEHVPGSITGIDAIQLYYTYRERNAWNWTRASHYFPGAINPTFGQAQEHAESMRTQGSVFFIATLPALLLNTTSGPLVAAQINAKAPFADYVIRPVIKNDSSGSKQKLPIVLRRGAKANLFASSLIFSSNYWRIQQPSEDSVFIFRVQAGPEGGKFERLADTIKATVQSRSRGPNYYLEWQTLLVEIKAVPVAVRRLAATAKRLKPLN